LLYSIVIDVVQLFKLITDICSSFTVFDFFICSTFEAKVFVAIEKYTFSYENYIDASKNCLSAFGFNSRFLKQISKNIIKPILHVTKY